MLFTARQQDAVRATVNPYVRLSACLSHAGVVSQDSIAIAKKTARCAQYMGALKSFESPHYAPGYCSRNFNGLLF